MKKLPTYRIIVNPDDSETGVYGISLVDEPAIEVDWIKLQKEFEDILFSANKDKQMLFGPLLIPDKLILRKAPNGDLYNIVFDKDSIQTIADKYNETGDNKTFNFQHSDRVVNAVLLQNWITGNVDKSQDYGFSLPEGTWFGGVKVKDESFWINEVKSEKVKGFSIEIKAETELVKMSKVKSIIAYRLSKTNSVMAKRECLGCPPNGDGTTTKGEPDRRCGGGGKKTAAPKVAKEPKAPAQARSENEIRSQLQDYNSPDATKYSKNSDPVAPAIKLNDAEVEKLKENMNYAVRNGRGGETTTYIDKNPIQKYQDYHDGNKLQAAGFQRLIIREYRNGSMDSPQHIGYINTKTNEIIVNDGPESRGNNAASRMAQIFR